MQSGITVYNNNLGVRDWEGMQYWTMELCSVQLEAGVEKYVVRIHEEFEDIL